MPFLKFVKPFQCLDSEGKPRPLNTPTTLLDQPADILSIQKGGVDSIHVPSVNM